MLSLTNTMEAFEIKKLSDFLMKILEMHANIKHINAILMLTQRCGL